MKPDFELENVRLFNCDCRRMLKSLPENSIDGIVTDPPYELGFMGKGWDASGIAYDVEMWKECLRVLKPGGHLLSFGGTRTYHRMAVAIEDAGFEIRDMIEWIYGSGFPKSLNIGKAVDKIAGESGRLLKFVEWYRTTGMKQKETNEIIGKADVGSHYLRLDQPAIPTSAIWAILRPHIKTEIPKWVDELVERIERKREVVGKAKYQIGKYKEGSSEWVTNKGIYRSDKQLEAIETKGTSAYEGWGTALKPAHEPICMARKPLSEKTVAENCLKWGTGGINIDESRVEYQSANDFKTTFRDATQETYKRKEEWTNATSYNPSGKIGDLKRAITNTLGRFPANLIHDNSEEVRECFPEASKGWGKATDSENSKQNSMFGIGGVNANRYDMGGGNASRFFKSIIYQAKASKSERNKGCEGLDEKGVINRNTFKSAEWNIDPRSPNGGYEVKHDTKHKNNHPTVKPIALMEYLINMITREGDTVLDPFLGSGTTGKAAINLNRAFIGSEMQQEYFDICKARIKHDEQITINFK